MTRYLGRLFGVLIGSAAGVLGALFGLMAGWLIDQFIRELPSGWQFEAFLKRPGQARAGHRTERYAVAALTAVLISAGGRASSQQVTLALSLPWPSESASRKDLPERSALLERGLALRYRVDLERSAAVLDGWSHDTRRELLHFLLALARADAEGVGVAERSVLQRIARGLQLSPETIEELERELGGLNREACDVLGVSPRADEDELRRAYRRLAAQFHPDTGGGLDPVQQREMAEAFVRVQRAYDELLTQLRRRRGA